MKKKTTGWQALHSATFFHTNPLLFFHLHLRYYKHSLSTRLVCSDSVRFVKVLSAVEWHLFEQIGIKFT